MNDHMPLDEWSDSSDSHKLLKANLETNARVFCPHLDRESQAGFLRVNLIVVRHFAEISELVRKLQPNSSDTSKEKIKRLEKSLSIAIGALKKLSWEGSSVNFPARTALNDIRTLGIHIEPWGE